MGHSTLDGFGRTNVDVQPENLIPDISDNIQQVLDRLMVFDYNNHIWRAVAGDLDGRLIISLTGVQVNTGVVANMALVAGANLVRPANSNRRLVRFYNNGAAILYIGFTAAVVAGAAFPFVPGSIYTEDLYTGDIWMAAPIGGGSLVYMEF